MMRRDTYNNIVKTARLLSLVVLMAFGAGLKGWGQDYTINSNPAGFPQPNIPELVETIYVKNGEERDLVVEELTGVDNASTYAWYVRWYRVDANGSPLPIEGHFKKGNVSQRTTSDDKSIFWYYALSYSNINSQASTVIYTGQDSEDIVICDVSPYVDNGLWNTSSSSTTINEPTISKRYKFIIKPYNEIKGKLSDISGDALETFYITVPDDATNINLQMDMSAESYYWDDNGTERQGDYFVYRTSSSGSNIGYYTDRIISINGNITSDRTIYVYAIQSGWYLYESPCLAKFVITTQEDAGFKLGTSISETDEHRNPSQFPKKYELAGYNDFDIDDKKLDIQGAVSYLTPENNVSQTPMDPSLTSYGFTNPALLSISPHLTPKRDHYGLYRSANVSNISKRPLYYNGHYYEGHYDVNSWAQGRTDGGSFLTNKYYDWYFPRVSSSDHAFYDRTYHETGKYGFFYYVDASVQAGRIVRVPINGTICANTELTVIAWLADLTDAATVPNINLLLWGENSGTKESEVLHRFSSGDLTQTANRAEWFQLCYNITIDRSKVNLYDTYYLEVQNNALNSDGADYAIDDVRIYRTLPNIQVQRENACDASTLIVSTDYETILRNMGWSEGDIVAQEKDDTHPNGFDYNNLQLRKYRYGLMGEDHQYKNSVVGNVYFAFMDKDLSEWLIVNKNAIGISEVASKAIRIPVSTVQAGQDEGGYEFYTTDRDQAMLNEKLMNLRAVNDYNKDIDLWNDQYPDGNHTPIPTDGIGIPGQEGFDEDKYQEASETLYNRLNIPRLRCPWYDAKEGNKGRLYLAVVDVNDTELKYQGETIGYNNDGEAVTASGEYYVISFSAADVADYEGATGVDPTSDCALRSLFTVYPAATILIETAMGEPETAACAGSLRKITAVLNGYNEDGEPVNLKENNISYLFDWYLDSMEAYRKDSIENNNISIKQVLESYREAEQDYDVITVEEVNNWDGAGSGEGKSRLIKLLNDGLLLTGSEGGTTFDLELPNTNRIVAIPYVYAGNMEAYTFCSRQTELSLPVEELDIPVINPGFPGITELDGGAPLRLGLRNMENTVTLKIPFTEYGLQMADGASHLGVSGNPEISFREGTSATLTPVGNVSELRIPKGYSETSSLATITITWNKDAVSSFEEGHEYELLFPFVQYDSNNQVLSSQCDGLGSLKIKIVPEYLTWQGDGSDVWYNDDNWNQSTEGELYFDQGLNVGTSTDDANGSDPDLTKAFAPLYFTKITINPKQDKDVVTADQLNLLKETKTTYTITSDGTTNTYELLNFGNSGMNISSNTTLNIEYDMAVDTIENGIKVVPYYGNKVDQIYFKPEATLMNQHYLDYQKAWVEFESIPETPYWMSSPLKGIYAGDMYAPSSNGRQETEAFKDITYSETANSRWNPAFYQKAWDKAITYSNNEDGTSTTSINAVKSNWSIEYNDVTVPYSLGKGFYSKVEKESAGNVLVRLPKADTEYKYETKTRALTNTGKQLGDYGRLADATEISIDLSKEDTETRQEEVDGNGTHFLVGNPYMTYLDMKAFFDNNTNLNRKFWTLDRDEGSIVVGTPDISNWSGNDVDGYHTVESTQSYVAPMTAFFVELSDKAGDDKTIEFTTAMMAAKPTTTNNVYTKSYSASNPILTLTAERGETRSVARLLTSDKGHDAYEASEDAVLLLDSELDAPMVYTVAGDVAAQFNTMQSIRNVPLGVYAAKGEEVELTIRGISQFADKLYLYDALTKQSTPLDDDSYTFRVTGPSHGRFTLTSQNRISAESDICVYSPIAGQLLVMSSPEEALQRVQVYDMSGRMVVSRDNIRNTTCQLSLASGIYIVYAENESGNVRVKIRIR